MKIDIKTILEALLSDRRESIYNNNLSFLKQNLSLVEQMIELPLQKGFEGINEKEGYENSVYFQSERISVYGLCETREECEKKVQSAVLSFWTLRHFIQTEDGVNTLPHFGTVEDSNTKYRIDQMMDYAITYDNGNRRLSTEAELMAKAEQMTENALYSFVRKMNRKLSSMGQIIRADIDDQWKDLVTTKLYVEYENGISFNLINSIVHKTSKRGKYFQQFPARFNDVSLNGVYQKGSQSEAKVKYLAENLG